MNAAICSPLGRMCGPSIAILIRSTPSLAWRRISAICSSRVAHRRPEKYSGVPTQLGNQSFRLCRLAITLLLAAMRGPVNIPALIALRTAMLQCPASPGTTTDV
ncbi:hypothetical protein D3C76_1313850 [compost metagenome]